MLPFCFVLVLALAGIATLAWAHSSRAGDVPIRYRVGDATVWAIADSAGDRDLGMFKHVEPEVLRRHVPSGTAPSAIMVFAIRRGNETILVDTGLGTPTGDRPSRLMPGLAAAGIRPEEVDAVLVTHMHGDHVGGLVWEGKKAFPNAKVIIGRIERDYWLASPEQFPSRKVNFDFAKKVSAMYADAIATVEFGAEALPGILAVDTVGHSPGHTAFLLESRDEKLMIVGDIFHAAMLQFPRPDINSAYDMIPERAARARKHMLEKAATENLAIAGIHLAFPGVGRVEKGVDGGYVFVALPGE